MRHIVNPGISPFLSHGVPNKSWQLLHKVHSLSVDNRAHDIKIADKSDILFVVSSQSRQLLIAENQQVHIELQSADR